MKQIKIGYRNKRNVPEVEINWMSIVVKLKIRLNDMERKLTYFQNKVYSLEKAFKYLMSEIKKC